MSDAVILLFALARRNRALDIGLGEDPGEVEALGLPVIDGLDLVEPFGRADQFAERGEAHRGEIFAHFLGDEEEVVDDMLGLALEALAQFRVLRGDADRAGVEMALAHHDAAGGDQRRRGEADLVGAEQRGDHHIAAGADAAIGLNRDAAAQMVVDERLLGFGKADFPGTAGMLDRGQRRGAGAAFIARYGHMIGMRLGDAGRDGADAHFGDELDRHLAQPG